MPFKDPAKRREYAAQRARKRFHYYYLQGLCPRCPEHLPVVPGKKSCSVCLPKNQASAYNSYWQNRYGLTKEAASKLRERPCQICGQSWSAKELAFIDHDHKTGKVRGVLCLACNRGLGSFKDDPELLARAASYLKEAALNA